jgi:hypothetical protein
MFPSLKTLFQLVVESFTDRSLQLILLGVVAAGFLFSFVLGADTYVVVGVVVIGFVAAFVESAHHRHRK